MTSNARSEKPKGRAVIRRVLAFVLLVVVTAMPITASAATRYTDQTKGLTPPTTIRAEENSAINPTKIETGLYKVDGTWKYYENGQFKAATGLAQRPDTGRWYYVEKGIYTKRTTICKKVQNDGNWYFVYNGGWKKSTGLAKRHDNGKWYYIENGIYSRRTTITKKIVKDGDNNWYYVQKGAYTKATGLAKRHDNGRWYYIKRGVYARETTVTKKIIDDGNWYYVRNGAYYNKYTGLVKKLTNGKYYYVQKGKYTKYTGLVQHGDSKWFVKRGNAITEYTNSSLVAGTVYSPNKFTRNGTKIKKITIHHMAGIMSGYQCGVLFSTKAKSASSNYGIGKDGEIWQYVDEAEEAKTSVSRENDIQAVTIEVSNNTTKDPWTISDKNLARLIELCTDICYRNDIEKLVYTGDATGNLTMHKYFAATGCPGPYLSSKFPYIAREVNKRLAAMRKAN